MSQALLTLSWAREISGALLGSDRALVRRRALRMARAVALTERADIELGLRLTSDAEIRVLNKQYRGKDKATDVLAFAQREGPTGELHRGLLGDVVISVETAHRQRKRKPLTDELVFLWAHGLCHLLGYDHETDAEEREMNARARALLDEASRRGPVRAA